MEEVEIGRQPWGESFLMELAAWLVTEPWRWCGWWRGATNNCWVTGLLRCWRIFTWGVMVVVLWLWWYLYSFIYSGLYIYIYAPRRMAVFDVAIILMRRRLCKQKYLVYYEWMWCAPRARGWPCTGWWLCTGMSERESCYICQLTEIPQPDSALPLIQLCGSNHFLMKVCQIKSDLSAQSHRAHTHDIIRDTVRKLKAWRKYT